MRLEARLLTDERGDERRIDLPPGRLGGEEILLQFCYADTRAQNPNLAGSATVAVTLAADGNVIDAGIVRRSWSGKGAETVESCVLARVKSWKFPANQLDDEKQVLSFAVVFTR